MPFVDCCRIETFLPANDPAERRAVDNALALVRDLFGGATVSLTQAPVFQGYYRGTEGWAEDQIVLVMVDLDARAADVEDTVASFHDSLARFYREQGSGQEEFWITVTEMQRFVPSRQGLPPLP